jgi:hypothetical protein
MIAHKQWLESQEDELIKSLLNNEIWFLTKKRKGRV